MHPSVLFVTSPFLVGGVLPVLGWNHIANAAPHLVAGDGLKRSSSSSYNHAMSVTVATFFEHATVDTDAPHSLAHDQLETVTTMYAPGVVTVAPTPGPMRPGSSSPHLRGANGDRVATTFAATTLVTSLSFSTSSFSDAICDDIFCNTDGNMICIYWAGVTSWDVSLGPIPGERPTIIGAC
ncbi:hypothetical protein EKO27_g3389 [Xylaria grammica]|uniref:Uncharacterized protein n=1 Tax=Xylaria grammica TaxID=363999 RepID=A0A439DBD6_9PEZI|nr:hypothetical protein EKO27_g3389 [Xylaria grammica]